MRKAKIFAAMLMAMSSLGAFAQHQFMVQANKPGVEIQPTMYGIFFEDINFGAMVVSMQRWWKTALSSSHSA